MNNKRSNDEHSHYTSIRTQGYFPRVAGTDDHTWETLEIMVRVGSLASGGAGEKAPRPSCTSDVLRQVLGVQLSHSHLCLCLQIPVSCVCVSFKDTNH